MRSYYQRCPVCESLDHEKLVTWFHVFPTPRPNKDIQGDVPMQDIVICRDCGMVFRNPFIPDLCPVYYLWDSPAVALKRVNPTFARRAEIVADEVARVAALRPGARFLDIGTGPGMVPKMLVERFPEARTVLMEPSVYALLYAKSQIPGSIALPGNLEETDLPKNAFALIMALGVDYLFADHRQAMKAVSDALEDGGLFYVERFFVDQPSYYRQPILDIDDLFGLNSMMNTWFGKQQFIDYLNEFFDVVHEFTYTYDTTPAPLSRPTMLTGVFCRKRPGGELRKRPITNYYDEHLRAMRARAPESSLEDLRDLASAGARNVMIAGSGKEARELAELIRKHDLFSIVGFMELSGPTSETVALDVEFKNSDATSGLNAILIASVDKQNEWLGVFEAKGLSNVAFPCFRTAQPQFWSDGTTNVQLKAFLPATLRRLGTGNHYTR